MVSWLPRSLGWRVSNLPILRRIPEVKLIATSRGGHVRATLEWSRVGDKLLIPIGVDEPNRDGDRATVMYTRSTLLDDGNHEK